MNRKQDFETVLDWVKALHPDSDSRKKVEAALNRLNALAMKAARRRRRIATLEGDERALRVLHDEAQLQANTAEARVKELETLLAAHAGAEESQAKAEELEAVARIPTTLTEEQVERRGAYTRGLLAKSQPPPAPAQDDDELERRLRDLKPGDAPLEINLYVGRPPRRASAPVAPPAPAQGVDVSALRNVIATADGYEARLLDDHEHDREHYEAVARAVIGHLRATPTPGLVEAIAPFADKERHLLGSVAGRPDGGHWRGRGGLTFGQSRRFVAAYDAAKGR